MVLPSRKPPKNFLSYRDMLVSYAKPVLKKEWGEAPAPVVLMVSGGSDSTALCYFAKDLQESGLLGKCAVVHVNHNLRGADSDGDEDFVRRLANECDFSTFIYSVDINGIIAENGGNLEDVARTARYEKADEVLNTLCDMENVPHENGRIIVAHTADDRAETFYMRSIVGTGPGGFRSIKYSSGRVLRPLLDISREQLREYLRELEDNGTAIHDDEGHIWREDKTNADTEYFRAFVRHNIVPMAKERNANLLETMTRTMNLIADEDEMLDDMASNICQETFHWLNDEDHSKGCLILPAFAVEKKPLQRRCVYKLMYGILGDGARITTRTISTVLEAIEDGHVVSGYTNNLQGNLALSSNKRGIRIEPMEDYIARRSKTKPSKKNR